VGRRSIDRELGGEKRGGGGVGEGGGLVGSWGRRGGARRGTWMGVR